LLPDHDRGAELGAGKQWPPWHPEGRPGLLARGRPG